MSAKTKRRLAHLGARVRVADNGQPGPDRWLESKTGTVAARPNQQGAQVLIDGETGPRFVRWADLDIAEQPRGHLLDVPISEVVPSRWQYRRRFEAGALGELAKSIERHGLVNALLVFKRGDGRFELIAGERRLRAASALALEREHPGLSLSAAVGITSALGWWADEPHLKILADAGETIRVELREGTADKWQEIAVIENLQRENPTAIEEATAYNALMVRNEWKQSDLARHLGKSEGFVSQRLSLLDLTDEAKEATHAGEIPFASARAIAKVPGPVQAAVTAQVVNKMAGDEPATTRQVSAFTGQVRRFLEPDRWQPAEGEVVQAEVRNRYRLLRHHVRHLLAGEAERAGEAVLELQHARGNKILGMKPATVADLDHLTHITLAVLSGASSAGWGGAGPWWRAYAQLNEYTCDRCQWSEVDMPAGAVKGGQCKRIGQPERKRGGITTCLRYIDPEDPVALFVSWNDERVIEETGAEVRLTDTGKSGDLAYATSVADHLQIREVINAAEATQEAEQKRGKEWGYLDDMAEYWAAQPLGAHGGLLLTHGLAQPCRGCRFHRPEVEALGPPCTFAAEPLKTGTWINAANRAPNYAVLVNEAGVSVPRCETYQAAEIPAFAPVKGLSFPYGKGGRGRVLGWLRRITVSSYSHVDHHGATPGILAWVPYDRDPAKTWDRDLLCRHVRDRWDEYGDAGVAHLLTSAGLEAKAKGAHGSGAFELLDPTTGKIERWGAVAFDKWAAGEVPSYGYPQGWPMPWIKAGDEAGS